MRKFKETTLDSSVIYNGKIIKVQVDTVKLPNGAISYREIVKHPGAAAVIPITSDNKLVFVEQYRKPLERSLLEIPAGKLETGEKSEMTALRELEEEIGYTTNQLNYVTSFYTSPGFADELIHIYVAQHIYPLDEPVASDDDEFINVVE